MTSQPTDVDIPAAGDTGGIRQAVSDYWARVRGGDIGSLPAVLGLVALVLLFGILEGSTFLSIFNFANLINQSAAIIVLAMGLIFVLLLGEIDLSAGFAAGTCAAVLAVALNSWEMAWPLALLLALLTGAVIGIVIGLLVARLGIPSFVVTLAMFLALQGAMLLIIGEGGTMPIRSDAILVVMNGNMPVWAGWLLAIIIVGGFALTTFLAIRRRRKTGLPAEAMSVWAIKVIALAVLIFFATYVLNQERQLATAKKVIQGVPWVVVVILVLLVGLTFILQRTGFGRHVYAVGGNREAARRAGINVKGLMITCFIFCSTLAAIAGVLLASRDNSVSP